MDNDFTKKTRELQALKLMHPAATPNEKEMPRLKKFKTLFDSEREKIETSLNASKVHLTAIESKTMNGNITSATSKNKTTSSIHYSNDSSTEIKAVPKGEKHDKRAIDTKYLSDEFLKNVSDSGRVKNDRLRSGKDEISFIQRKLNAQHITLYKKPAKSQSKIKCNNTFGRNNGKSFRDSKKNSIENKMKDETGLTTRNDSNFDDKRNICPSYDNKEEKSYHGVRICLAKSINNTNRNNNDDDENFSNNNDDNFSNKKGHDDYNFSTKKGDEMYDSEKGIDRTNYDNAIFTKVYDDREFDNGRHAFSSNTQLLR